MATVICTTCQRPENRSFYRGYRLAEDHSSCCKAKMRRYKRGMDRFWRGNECGKHWPPVAGVDAGTRCEVAGAVWRWHDYKCPTCDGQFCCTEYRDVDGNFTERNW